MADCSCIVRKDVYKRQIYGGPALVIDYGTATTYDIVTENGVFLAGVIAPGIRTSANVLYPLLW